MSTRALALLLVVGLLMAGCVGTGQDPASTDGNDTAPASASSSADSVDDATNATASSADEARSLSEPPVWEGGEWWTVRIYSSLIDEDVTVTRVVTGTEGEDYLVGIPQDSWDGRALVFHVPGFGEVRRSDLSFEAHDVRFELLDFPLTPGKTWTTEFEGLPVDVTVEEATGTTAELSYCCGRSINATYDASIGAISALDVDDGFIGYEVLDHGYNYTGVVTVPHGHDLVFNHGRFAGAIDVRTTRPAPPVETMELSSDYGRVSFVQIVGPLGIVDRPASNVYVERTTSPNGTTYETQHLPTDGGSFSVQFFETTELGGTWQFEHVAPGPGLAFTEGIAYHVFDIELPGGHLLGDHSQHRTP